MKKWYIGLLAFAFLLTLLSGCITTDEKNVNTSATDGTVNTTVADPSAGVGSVADTQESVSATTSTVTKTATASTASARITRDEAKRIALNAAGIDEKDLSRLQIELDYDDDAHRWEYEVDFYVGDREYDIDVHADTGEILRMESETENSRPLSTTSGSLISRDEAKSIALTKAEVTAEDISDYEIELDYDEDAGRWEYEISFNVGRVEYECEVHAKTGQIIYWITDIDN